MLSEKEDWLCNRYHGYAQLYTGIRKVSGTPIMKEIVSTVW